MKRIITLSLFVFIYFGAFSQGTVPNGGFETWTDTVTCASWGSISVAPIPPFFPGFYGMTRSTDAHSGTYAAKLQTKTIPSISTLPGVTTLGAVDLLTQSVTGGTPFTQRPQTLSFWYKYQPAGTDSMMVVILLTKRNTTTNITDTVAVGYYTTGTAATTYTQQSITLNYLMGVNPDTLNILALASSGQMTDGSTLYVDDFTLSGTVVGISNETMNSRIDILPNPSNGVFEIITASNADVEFRICNAIGKEVLNGTFTGRKNMNLQHLPKGVYFAEILNGKQKTVRKIVIQ